MDYEEEQSIRQITFIDTLLGGVEGYPPAGWHSIEGTTGRTALIWSLCKLRFDMNGRGTLILPMAEPYDYHQVAVDWAHMDPRLIILTRRNHKLLQYALWWIRSGLVGQVIMENLGFLLGNGTISEELSYMLGPTQHLWEMSEAALEHDVALYTTSYAVHKPGAPRYLAEQYLGGTTLLHLTSSKRLLLEKTGNHLRAARRYGEFYEVTNALDRQNRKQHFEIIYNQGPVRIRQVGKKTAL